MVNTVRYRSLASGLVLVCVLLFSAVGSASATTNASYRWRLFLAINETRTAHGLHPLHLSSNLRGAAQRHSNDMVGRDYFAHTSPTGSTLFRRVANSGFQTFGSWWAGENLAWGTGTMGTPRYTVKMWLASPVHRANLLSSSYGWVGIGRTKGRFLGHRGAIVWTVDFAHR
jgi:uncharacterized protein YkwD